MSSTDNKGLSAISKSNENPPTSEYTEGLTSKQATSEARTSKVSESANGQLAQEVNKSSDDPY